MPITKAVSSRANAKQLTSADVPQQPTNMVTAKYTATSTASQTVINLTFAVDQTNTTNFLLSIDGRVLREGASNDFTFTNVAANNTSNQVTLNAAIVVGLNIQAWYLGLLVPASATTSLLTLQATINTQPTVQRFLAGSGTYTTPAGVKYIKVRMVGGGGGGGGSGTTNGTAATAGGNTSFGTSLLVATGGQPGSHDGTEASNSANTVNSPAVLLASVLGQNPGGSTRQNSAVTSASPSITGGAGGNSVFGGGGYAGMAGQSGAGGNAQTNSGSGGGGAEQGVTSSSASGSGGFAGSYVEAFIASPSTTYSYAVGSGGTGQAAGTSGFAGGNGAAGIIIVEEFYV